MPGIIGILKGKMMAEGAKLVGSIGEAIDRNVTNKEERERARLEAEKEVNRSFESVVAMTLADVASARDLQKAALAQDDLFSKRFLYYLASFIIVSATAFGVGLFFYEIPEANRRMVEMFADVYLFAGALVVINFFFGNAIRNVFGGGDTKRRAEEAHDN